MNSTEGLKGFITFSILSLIVSAMVFSFNYFRNQSSFNSKSGASNNQILPIALETSDIKHNHAEILWLTETPTSGKVLYSTKQSCKNDCIEIVEKEKLKSHKIILDDLQPDTTYYYQIKVDKNIYPDEPLSFTTKKVDVIAEVEIEEITTSEQSVTTSDGPSKLSQPSIVSPDGYYNSQPFNEGPFNTTEPKKIEQVLGEYSDIVSEELFEEFKEALIYQDKNYDFNKDGKITNQDYPLFMYFIVNQ